MAQKTFRVCLPSNFLQSKQPRLCRCDEVGPVVACTDVKVLYDTLSEFKAHTVSNALNYMRIVKLKPPQIIKLFGWLNLKPFLQWDDVETSVQTFRSLRGIGLTSAQLYLLQPDVLEWKKHGSITLDDCHEMTLWPIHPCHDLGATLDQIMTKQWKPTQMMHVGLTLRELTRMGMSTDNMVLFGYPLSGWIDLGLDREYIDSMADDQIRRVFNISRAQVLHALPLNTSTKPPPIDLGLVRPIRHM
jgi:hypothetical protein